MQQFAEACTKQQLQECRGFFYSVFPPPFLELAMWESAGCLLFSHVLTQLGLGPALLKGKSPSSVETGLTRLE